MTALAGTLSRLRSQIGDYQRSSGGQVTAVALWLLIGAFFTWAAIEERQLFVIGLIVGSVLALGAIGLTLIYGVLKFGNFAQGDSMMLGAYVAFFFLTGLVKEERRDTDLGIGFDQLPGATDRLGDLSFGYGFVLATAAACVILVAFCVGIDRLVYRRLRRRKSNIVVISMASLGVAFALRAVLLMIWGPEPRTYVGGIFPKHEYPFDILLKTNEIFTFIVALAMAAGVYVLLFRTRLGKAMRAYADNPDLALVSGINTERVITWTWAIAGVLVAVGGVLLALQANLKPELGFQLLLPLFAAAILGGLGKPQGAFVGALVVGVFQEVSVAYFSAGYKPAVAFVILILILLVRPKGLFGSTN
jgi:branched-chain amino acid transport system permease protein/neutral amino acid transport system permease protein